MSTVYPSTLVNCKRKRPPGPNKRSIDWRVSGSGGAPTFRIPTADLHVAELGVRHEPAIHHERGADPGAQRGDEHDAVVVLGGAEVCLGQPGGVGVVHHQRPPPGDLGQQLVRVGADPGGVDVGGRAHHAVLHDGGKGAAEGSLPVEVVQHLADHGGHRVRGGRLRRRHPEPLLGELAFAQVHRGALDPRTADVHAEPVLGHGRQPTTAPPPHAVPIGYRRTVFPAEFNLNGLTSVIQRRSG